MADTLILTTQGRQAISNALATGTQVFPKTFKFITPILPINENYTASTINQSDIWYSADITEYDVDSTYQTVSFNCIVEANLATAKTGTVGLYFDDGTLFAIASLSSQLPKGTRQGVYLRINMDSSQAAFNFNFISANDYLHNTDSIYIGTTSIPLNRTSGVMSLDGVVVNEPLGTIASAATTNISKVNAKTIRVTGTTTITSFGTAATGVRKTLIFDGILTLTHNATTLILPTGANITTAVGDTAEFVKESGGWRCIDYQRANGSPLGKALIADKLTTPRKINGVNFDGSADITVADATKEPAFDILPIAKGGTGNNSGTTYTTDGNVLRVTNPKGGTYTINSANVTGAIKITLPQSWSRTMMKFTVEVYNHATQKSFTAEIAGYNDSNNSTWYNTSAQIISGGNANYAIRFGHDGTKCCVYIGETSSTWVHPKIVITDFQAGYLNIEPSKWIAGWSIGFTDTLGTITSTLTDVQVLNNTSFATQAEVNAGTVTNKAVSPGTLFGNKRFMIVEEQSAYNSAAVSGKAGINTRTPNTVIYNNTTGSLSNGAISGISGTIRITIEAIASVNGGYGNHRVLLYKNDKLLTAGTHILSNINNDANASASTIDTIINIIATDSLTIKHELNGTGYLQNSYGANYTNTANKVHSRITIEQLKG